MKMVRIGAAQGFWGDYQDAAKRQLEGGELDYLVFDYLAELTMSILAKQKSQNAALGYAKDFPKVIKSVNELLVKNNVKVIANAGGVNPKACADKVKELLVGTPGEKLNVAIVYGDNISGDIDKLVNDGASFEHMENGGEISKVKDDIVSANVYLGSKGMFEALQAGADIVITGRVADAAMPLAALQYEFSWSFSDYDKLALGIVAGHIIECGSQASGGNCSYRWEEISDLHNVGFPIIEAYEDGSLFITKHKGTGGTVSLPSVKEQLVYEIGDPSNYITPDVIADFTSVKLREVEKDKVEVYEVKGTAPTESYKVSLCYANGFKASGTLIYTWPDAFKKVKAAEDMIRKRLEQSGFVYDEVYAEAIGLNACHGGMLEAKESEPKELMLRMSARSQEKQAMYFFAAEIAPLVLSGPPGASGYAGGRPKPIEIFSYWPTLIPKKLISYKMELVS